MGEPNSLPKLLQLGNSSKFNNIGPESHFHSRVCCKLGEITYSTSTYETSIRLISIFARLFANFSAYL